MKKFSIILLFISIFFGNAFAQTDTISSNIYQNNNKLGIGTTEPFTWLSVMNDAENIDWNIETSIAEFQRKYDNSTARFLIYGYPNTEWVLPHVRKSVMLYATGDAKDLILCASQPEGRIRFFTQTWANPNSERMVIDSGGFVGIGTTEAYSRLQIADGDIYISDIEKGIIMKSPDGNCWKGTLDNDGVLNFIQIDCPEYTMVSIQDTKSSNQVNIYPNPTEGKLTLTNLDHNEKKMKYSIYSINGSVVEHGKLSNDNEAIDISGYSSGIYVIKVFAKNGDLVSSNKVIKN